MVSFSVLLSLVCDSLCNPFTLCLGLLGHGGNLAAEYLKENLLKNLMKHPEFLTDTKLAISNVFYFCLAVSFHLLKPFLILQTHLFSVTFANHRQNIS